MSIDNNNIDQMFSDAAHSQKAPQYDSAYWAEMNAMLNAKDAKKRGFILWAFGGSALFAALFLSLFILNMDFNKPQERYAKTALSSDLTTDQTSTGTDVEQTTETDKENLEQTVYAADEVTANNKTDIHHTSTTVGSPVEKQNEVRVTENNTKTSNSTVTRTATKSSSRDATKTNISVNKNSNVPNKSEHGLVSQNENSNLNKEVRNSEELTDFTTDSKSNKSTAETNDIVSLPYDQTNSIEQNDPGSVFNSRLKYKPKARLSIYAKVSGGLMENYKTSRPYESGLVDLSLNFEMNFNGVVLRSGVGAQHTSKADLILSQRAKVYGFGVTRHQNDLSYQSLFDLYIPLELGYRVNGTSFGIGVQGNYLLTTGMDLNLYENHNLVGTEKYFGSTNGLNKFSTQGYVWMEHQFTSLFSLGAKVGTNISGRIKDDSYFNQSSTTNPIYGQLTLRFNIR